MQAQKVRMAFDAQLVVILREPNSLLKNLHRGHSERSEGGKAGGTPSRNPVEGPGQATAKADVCLLRELFVISRGSSTARRATFARRGAPLGMTREKGVSTGC